MAFSMAKWLELSSVMNTFEEEFFGRFNCDPEDLTLEKIKNTNSVKAILSDWVMDFAVLYHKMKSVTAGAADKIEDLNSRVVKGQEKIIVLQEELIRSKEEQLACVRTAVRDEMASVHTSVKTELRSWSESVGQNAGQSISAAQIKAVVKSAAVEEDKSRNFMIFGKSEVAEEDVAVVVAELLHDMNEKPRLIECRRIGAAGVDKSRPIKVKLSSSDAVVNVLRSAKALKNSSRNKTTFVAPDRSKEERLAHKKLVERMKLKMRDEPGMYHYIRGGTITSVKKS
jgi:hypothetical protein